MGPIYFTYPLEVLKVYMYCIYSREDMKLRERIPHTWTSYNENYLKSIFDSASYCVVILMMTPHWSVRMASCNFTVVAFFLISQNMQHLSQAKLASAHWHLKWS